MAPKQRNTQAIQAYDVVELKSEGQEPTQPPSLGLVWRTADDSDNSDDDFSDDDSLYEQDGLDIHHRLQENHAEVVWISDEASRKVGTEIERAEEDISHLLVVDRCMQQGDVVASAADPLGQTGLVLEVTRDVDVVLSTGQVLERQPSHYLQPEIVFQPHLYVLHNDGWFGRINHVYIKVTVAFESGAIVELTDMEHYERPLLKAVTSEGKLAPTVSEASEFYPGQHVVGDPHLRGFPGTHVVKGALHCVGSYSSLKGIVVKVEAYLLEITWLNTLHGGDLKQAPPGPIEPSVCTPITELYFCPAYWHLGTIGLWRGDGASASLPPAEPSQKKSIEGAKRSHGGKQGRTKGSPKESAAINSNERAVPYMDVTEGAAQLPCAAVQQLSLAEKPPSSETEAAGAGGKAATASQGESTGAVGSRMVAQGIPSVGSVPGDTQPDSLQAHADGVVADCISSILDDVTLEELVARSPKRPVQDWNLEDAQERDVREEEEESGWTSMGRRGWDAAAAVMSAVGGLGRATPLTQDSTIAHGARRSRHGGKKRGRGRRAAAAQPTLQLKDLPVTAQVLRTYTRATIHWQDGSITKDMDSAVLLPMRHTDEHDFFPNSFVRDKTDDLDEGQRMRLRTGLVKSVDHSQRTANVLWHRGTQHRVPGPTCTTPECLAQQEKMLAETAEQYREIPPSLDVAPYEEVVSVYTIEPHFQFEDLGVGNVIARLDFRAAAAEGRLRGSVGSILNFEGFSVQVHWLDGTQSTVTLEEIFVIGVQEDLDDYVSGEDDEDNLDSDSECDDIDVGSEEDTEGYITDEEGGDEPDEASLDSDANAVFRDTVLHVHGSIRREPENMNDAWRAASVSDIDGSSPRTVGDGAVYEEEDAALTASDAPVPSGGASEAGTIARAPSGLLQSSAAAVGASESADDYGFPHFEATEEDPIGFEEMPIDTASTRPSRGFQRAVLKEWNMLREGLPPTIWVRAFESRMDVMRAAILGAAGTPYHDQLFFFDIQLSPDHPANVPKVLFHSHGNRINPNLYNDGKVCLSLLNTWNGRRTEQWDPTSSTILQVLVSIQGLILVAEPYYNEAGFEKQVGTLEGARNAVVYNESAFLATIRTTLSLLRSPPAPFQPLLLAVFQNRRDRLLTACNAYMAGTARVGAFTEAGALKEGPEGEQQQQVEGDGVQQAGQTTQGFQLVFKGVLPRLEKALMTL